MDQSNCDDLEQVSSNTPNGIEMRVDTIRDTKDQKERQNVEIAILEHENVQHQNGQQSSSSSACFIDASSLLDENEIIGDIMDLPHPVVPNPSSVDIPFTESFPRKLSERSASSSSSGSLNNLSDEEKLLKREIKKTFGDIKDQYNCDGVELRRKTFPAPVAGTPSLNDRRLAELERKQGELIFKNNIQHFSSHLMNNNSNISTITNNLNSNPSIDIYDTQQPRKFSNSSEKSYFLPDTPHNSIAHVDNSSSNSLNSPKLFRKSKCDESSPIISGGINTKFESSSSSIDEIQRDLSSASSSKNSKSHNQSWVVDMSHSGPASARPRSSSTSGNESISSIERKSNPSMGFYVSLHDMDSSPKSLDSTITFNNFKKEKKSTEFYIDFSDTSREGTPKMARKKPAFLQRRSEEKEPEDKKLKEAEDVTLRKSLSSSVEKDSSKRHTWGSDSGDMKILDKISLISKVSNSSNSIDDSTYTKSVNLYGGTTYDKHSSQDSLTDALLSSSTKKSTSSTEETEELTYQEENDDKSPAKPAAAQHFGRFPGIMETIMESKESSSPSKTNQFKHHTMETLQATMEKQLQLLENGSSENGCFVKLSDMDKPSPKFELHSPEMSKSTGNRQINRIFFDSRSSNRPHSWAMTRSTGNNIMNITSSMDNLKSITRLFPHLSKELSNSLPNYIPFQNSPTPPYCVGQSDLSMDSSSLTSSFSRSAMDESSMSCRQPRRLGEDLLKMFIQELATDVAIEVNGRLIKAHKCILRSRCQYFAAMLAGDWNDGNNSLALPGFSYSSVHFALCHIYSGASHPPEGISLMELAALADLLGLEGLKEVTSHALKVNYCHNFHKPCSGCIDGILQVLPVALNHALDDLYRKCLKWTCKYYMKVWPTRHFAQLPEDIFKRCRQQIVAYMSSESVLETILDCDSLLSHLATYRWAVAVETLTRDILESAYNYISDHFANVIASDYFLSLGHDKYKYIMHLENIILHTAATLCPDQACRSYQRITRLNAVLAAKVITFPSNPEELLNCVANGEMKNLHLKFEDIEKVQQDWHEDFIRLVSAILSAVEQCLIRQCSRAMRGMSWQRMDIDLRKKIQTLARLNDPLEFRRTSAASSTGSGGGGKPVAKAFSFGGSSSRTQNLIQVKLAMQASKKTIHTQTNDFQENQNRVTNYNSNYNNVGHGTTGKESASTRNLSTTKPKPKLSTTKRSQQSEDVIKPPVKPRSKLSNVPPRYLEPKKLPPQPPEKKKSVVEKSNTMSLDSLASPRKKLDRTKTEPEKDICTDSLGVSTKSSFISDHLTSQESLTRGGVQRTTLAAQAKTVANRKISNNSSSSSVTNRSSKFSSLNSMNSPAAAFQKRSISVPGTTSDKSSPSSVASESKKKSFLSAKSREILAKRDERNKQQQQKQQQQHVTVEVTRPTNNRNYNIGKSSSVSNIPTRKNTNVLRNLNLRNSQIAAVTSAKSRTSSPRTPSTKIPSQVKLAAPEPITPEKPDSSSENPDIMSISKLERSSTFCMETSDLPVSELQIIE